MSNWQYALILSVLFSIQAEQFESTPEPSWRGANRIVATLLSMACAIYAGIAFVL